MNLTSGHCVDLAQLVRGDYRQRCAVLAIEASPPFVHRFAMAFVCGLSFLGLRFGLCGMLTNAWRWCLAGISLAGGCGVRIGTYRLSLSGSVIIAGKYNRIYRFYR